jgi:SlyX protein
LANVVETAGLAVMNDERVALLEERLAWLQRHVAEQDKAVLELAGEVDRLKRKVLELSQRPGADSGTAPVVDECPPHY